MSSKTIRQVSFLKDMDFRRRTIKACYERTDWAELTNNSYPVIGDKKNGKTCETIGWSHIPFAINTLFSWHYFHRKTQTHGKECVIIEEMTWNRVCLKMTKDLTKDTRKEMTFLWQDIRERKKYNRKQGDRKTISWDAEEEEMMTLETSKVSLLLTFFSVCHDGLRMYLIYQ